MSSVGKRNPGLIERHTNPQKQRETGLLLLEDRVSLLGTCKLLI